jgi:hypothetical protein
MIKNKSQKCSQKRKGSSKQVQKIERIINFISALIKLITAVLDIIGVL